VQTFLAAGGFEMQIARAATNKPKHATMSLDAAEDVSSLFRGLV